MPLFETGYLNAEVPVYKRTMTTYSRFGNWMIYVLFVISILYSIYLFILLKKENKFEKEIQVDFISFDDIIPDEEIPETKSIEIEAIQKELCYLKKMVKAMMIIVSITLILILIILFKFIGK